MAKWLLLESPYHSSMWLREELIPINQVWPRPVPVRISHTKDMLFALVMSPWPMQVSKHPDFHLIWKEGKHHFLLNVSLIQYSVETAATCLPLPWVNLSGNGAKIKEAEPRNREVSPADRMPVPQTRCFLLPAITSPGTLQSYEPSMGFSRQEYWSGLLFPSPKDSILPV